MELIIPQEVKDAIEEVRDSGVTNMMDYPNVMHEISENGHHTTYMWIHDNVPRRKWLTFLDNCYR